MGDNKSRAVKPQINASKNLMLMRINTSFITYGGVLLLTVILATLLRLSPLHRFDEKGFIGPDSARIIRQAKLISDSSGRRHAGLANLRTDLGYFHNAIRGGGVGQGQTLGHVSNWRNVRTEAGPVNCCAKTPRADLSSVIRVRVFSKNQTDASTVNPPTSE